jgi:hypothetical protein
VKCHRFTSSVAGIIISELVIEISDQKKKVNNAAEWSKCCAIIPQCHINLLGSKKLTSILSGMMLGNKMTCSK